MRRSRLLAFVGFVLLIFLAGCVGSPVGEAEPRIKPRPNSESTTGSSDDLSALTSWAAGGTTVTITRMIDRETMEIEYVNGTEDTIRPLGVGTPETTLSHVSSDGYPGIDDSTAGRGHLHEWARRQLHWSLEIWKAKDIEIVVDADSDQRGYVGRLLVYVYVTDENINHRLLADGYT